MLAIQSRGDWLVGVSSLWIPGSRRTINSGLQKNTKRPLLRGRFNQECKCTSSSFLLSPTCFILIDHWIVPFNDIHKQFGCHRCTNKVTLISNIRLVRLTCSPIFKRVSAFDCLPLSLSLTIRDKERCQKLIFIQTYCSQLVTTRNMELIHYNSQFLAFFHLIKFIKWFWNRSG